MNTGKFDDMYKLLFDNKHEINRNIPDKLKCIKCKNILINACQVPCGCQYCYDCVNEMLQNNVVHCPGNTDDCKEEYLSNNQLDFRANKEISKLIVKCPEETCLHECELIKMEEHLRICDKKSLKCPFAVLGCDNRKMASEILNEHCQSSNFNHCKILIEMIDNIKNEIDKLENELQVKSELIDSVNEEMKLVKLENEDLKQKFEFFNENMEKRFEEISKEMKNENLQIIESMKVMTIETNNKSEMMETKMNEMNEIIDKFEYATIEWTIDKLNEKKNNDENILSEYFTSKIKPYKLKLSFYADGINDFKGKGCCIFLRIYSSANDDILPWPCKCDITISIVNKTDPNLNKTLTNHCELNKSSTDSYNSSNVSNPRVQFNFSYEDLTTDGVMQNHCFHS